MKLTRRKVIIYGLAIVFVIGVFLITRSQQIRYQKIEKFDMYAVSKEMSNDLCFNSYAQYYYADYKNDKKILIVGSDIKKIKKSNKEYVISTNLKEPTINRAPPIIVAFM